MFFLKRLNGAEMKKIIKFGVTGVTNTAVDYLAFWLLSALGVGILAAQTVGYAAGTLNSYLINRKWTFGSKQRFFSGELVKFILSNLIVLLLSFLPLSFCVEMLHWGELPAKLVTTAFTLVLNFLLSRLWVFRKKNEPSS